MPWFSRSTLFGEALGDVGRDVEAFHKGAVVEVQDLQQELDGGVLLELEALADGTDVSSMMPTRSGRLVCWVKRRTASGGRAVVEQAEVLALEAGDEAALLVGDGEDRG